MHTASVHEEDSHPRLGHPLCGVIDGVLNEYVTWNSAHVWSPRHLMHDRQVRLTFVMGGWIAMLSMQPC